MCDVPEEAAAPRPRETRGPVNLPQRRQQGGAIDQGGHRGLPGEDGLWAEEGPLQPPVCVRVVGVGVC